MNAPNTKELPAPDVTKLTVHVILVMLLRKVMLVVPVTPNGWVLLLVSIVPVKLAEVEEK